MSGRRYLVLMGPPGAGKGTQASRVAEQGGLCKISTGDLLREAVAAGSELGRKAEQTMKAGELVSDDVILGLVDEVLDRPECAEGAVFDGFPRTVEQAAGLQELLSERGERLDQVLIIEVPEAEIVSRLSGRRVCKSCGKLYHISFGPSRKEGVCDACAGELVQRPDDQPETIARRLAVYAEETAPVREHYAATTGVTAIDGDQPIDAVTEAIRREIERMRASGRIVAEVLAALEAEIRPGVTTVELDRLAERIIHSHEGARPAFKGYGGFPASICASVNEEVVHGIPSLSRRLEAGDIIGIDVGVLMDGYHADAARTFAVGPVSEETGRLLAVTRSALEAGIEAAQPGARLGDVSAAIQSVAEKAGFSIVRDLVGHGIGQHLHEDPQVPNFGVEGRGLALEPGLVIAIEPMVNVGGSEVRTLEDAWTIVTIDGSLSAHFEHTVAITETGPDVLTRVA